MSVAITDKQTGEPIPFASYAVVHPNGGNTAGAADADGQIMASYIQAFTGGDITITSAGYLPNTMSVNTALNLGGIELDEGGALPEFVYTFVRKAKKNPEVIIGIIGLLITMYIYRKQLSSLFK